MKLREVEVEWLDTCELPRCTPPFFSWASKDNKQASRYTSCRDRLTICARAGLHGMAYSNYRTAVMPPVCFDETRLLITAPYEIIQKEFLETGAMKLLGLLHSAECQMGLERKTEVFKVSNDNKYIKSNGGAYLLVADSLWMRSTPMISMYALLVRISAAHDLGNHVLTTLDDCSMRKSPLRESDAHYVLEALAGMKQVLKYGERIWHPTPEENYPINTSDGDIEFSGIKGFTEKVCKIPAAKHWYRDLDVDEPEITLNEKRVMEEAA